MHWGPFPASDGYSPHERWDTLATKVGTRVHRACPRWLIVVEGGGQRQHTQRTAHTVHTSVHC